MTIANIHEVIDRIMGLNKNLTEATLRTLLIASGWDQGDIEEGVKIFKIKVENEGSPEPIIIEKKIEVPAATVVNAVTNKEPEKKDNLDILNSVPPTNTSNKVVSDPVKVNEPKPVETTNNPTSSDILLDEQIIIHEGPSKVLLVASFLALVIAIFVFTYMLMSGRM